VIGIIKASPNLKNFEASLGISNFVRIIFEVLKNCPIVEELKLIIDDDDNSTEIDFYKHVLDIVQHLTSLKHLELHGSPLNHKEGQKILRRSKSLITLKMDFNIYVKAEATFSNLGKVFTKSNPFPRDEFDEFDKNVHVNIIVC